MGRYVAGRLGQGILVVLGAIAISFALANLTGNAVEARFGSGVVAAETREQLIREYGLDRPLLERFGDYVVDAARGDFGRSFGSADSALSLVVDAVPYTLILVAGAISLACLFGLPVALYSVLHRDSKVDVATRRVFILLQGLPDFFVAVLLVLIFAVTLRWVPSFGVSGVVSYVLPIVALSLPLLSTLTRLLRAQLLDILGTEFVTALRVKGLTAREVVLRHGVRNALPPLIAYLALQLGWLLGGTILVEMVFGIPGIGQLAISSTLRRDLAVVQAIVVLVAVAYVVLNLLADLIVYALDPRVRGAYS